MRGHRGISICVLWSTSRRCRLALYRSTSHLSLVSLPTNLIPGEGLARGKVDSRGGIEIMCVCVYYHVFFL